MPRRIAACVGGFITSHQTEAAARVEARYNSSCYGISSSAVSHHQSYLGTPHSLLLQLGSASPSEVPTGKAQQHPKTAAAQLRFGEVGQLGQAVRTGK